MTASVSTISETGTGTSALVTTAAPHGLVSGQAVTISGASVAVTTLSLCDFIKDDRALRALYGDAAPSLAAVYLHSVSLLLPDRAVRFAVSLRDYPRAPPAKWASAI